MPTAASIADVETLIGVTTLSTDATASARTEALIERAERTVLDDLPGFTLGAVDDDTVTVEGTGEAVLLLPYYPVRSVTSVTVDGVDLDVTEVTFDVLGNLRRRYTGVTNPHLYDGNTIRWPDRGVDIVVVYSYGYPASATPGAVRDVVAELAAGRIVNPMQVAQEGLGDRSISFGGADNPNGDGLNKQQRHRLRHWRRNRYGTTRVRSS